MKKIITTLLFLGICSNAFAFFGGWSGDDLSNNLTVQNNLTVGNNVGIGSTNPRGALDVGTGKLYGDGSTLTGIAGGTTSSIAGQIVIDGTVYAKTNAGIEAALATCPAGGCVIIMPVGAYNITGDIDVDRSNVIFRGDGAGTVLTLANATNTDIFNLNGYDKITIEKMMLDGNKANQTTGGRAINIESGSTDITIRYNIIHDTYSTGIRSILSSSLGYFSFRFSSKGKPSALGSYHKSTTR